MQRDKNLPIIVLCYLAIYLIWGSTYFFIAKAVETIPAPWIVGTRFLFAGLIMTLIPILMGKIKRFPSRKEIGTSLFLGFFLLIMGNGVVTVAEKSVDSYIASLIVSTIPLVVVGMNAIFYKTKLNLKQILAFIIGFIGVALLIYSETPKGKAELTGILLLFLAITCWGFGTSWSKKLKHHPNTLLSTGLQMLFAGSICLIIVLFQGVTPRTILQHSSNISLLSLLFLTVVGGTAIVAYNYLLKNF